MNRKLDGIYMRIKRDGKWQNICLSDMTETELQENLKEKQVAWLKGAVIHLAMRLRYIGDELDIEMER